jgi:hypothetical protein
LLRPGDGASPRARRQLPAAATVPLQLCKPGAVLRRLRAAPAPGSKAIRLMVNDPLPEA